MKYQGNSFLERSLKVDLVIARDNCSALRDLVSSVQFKKGHLR